MANACYKKYNERCLGAGLNLSSGVVKATLIDAAFYTVDINNDQYMNTNTVASAARVGSHVTLAGKTITAGVFDANDITFTAVSGATVEAILIWVDGGDGGSTASGTNDVLVLYIDTATNLPVTPNGGDIGVTWHASGIFQR